MGWLKPAPTHAPLEDDDRADGHLALVAGALGLGERQPHRVSWVTTPIPASAVTSPIPASGSVTTPIPAPAVPAPRR